MKTKRAASFLSIIWGKPCRISALASFLMLFLLLAALPQQALADQLILNGSFKKDAASWQTTALTKGIAAKWDGAGYMDAGSLMFSIPGRRAKGQAFATQRINPSVKAGSRGRLEFAWKKNWSAILPFEQKIYIDLVKPDKTSVTVWSDTAQLNDNTWATGSVDISSYLDQTGTYLVRPGVIFENGNAKGAATFAWFDSIKLDITAGVDSTPKTSILNPTGAQKLIGNIYAVNGVATDDAGVTNIEVSIFRTYDNSWWNGSSWVKSEFWDNAKITSGGDIHSVTWSYPWPLPTSDGAYYKISARSIDITGNHELIPITNLVSIDNVGPTGNIFIEDAASYTNHRQVKVDMDIRGAGQMRFSTNNGRSWTDWESFATSKTIGLPRGDGAKIVSAQFKDDSDNSYQVSDSIVLDSTPPVTRHMFPAANATKIPVNSSIGVTFYEDMAPSSFKNEVSEQDSTFYIKQGSRWIAAAASYDKKAKSAKLVPKNDLEPGTVYTVYMNGGVKDAAGNSLAANISWNFTTSGSFSSTTKNTVGRSGGTVEGRDRLISLEIPADALAADINITVEELQENQVQAMKGITRHSPIYRMAPDSLPFNTPATLKVKYDTSEVEDPTTLRLVAFNNRKKTWDSLPNAAIDLVNHQIIAPISTMATVAIVAQGDSAAPSSDIMSPTGAQPIGGRAITIYGLSTDNAGVASVEIALIRQSDTSYWNGKSWINSERWVKANIISGANQEEAAWSYLWTLPQDRYATYQLKVRATDINGNIERSTSFVQIKLSGN